MYYLHSGQRNQWCLENILPMYLFNPISLILERIQDHIHSIQQDKKQVVR